VAFLGQERSKGEYSNSPNIVGRMDYAYAVTAFGAQGASHPYDRIQHCSFCLPSSKPPWLPPPGELSLVTTTNSRTISSTTQVDKWVILNQLNLFSTCAVELSCVDYQFL